MMVSALPCYAYMRPSEVSIGPFGKLRAGRWDGICLTRIRLRLYTPNTMFAFLMALPIVLLLVVYLIYRSMIKSEDSSVRLLGNVIGGGMAVVTCVLALVVRPMVLESDIVTSDSMTPTFQVMDRVFTDKLSYAHREPRRGEIVIFRFPSQEAGLGEDILIKRVIGLPGDEIEVKDGAVYRDGVRISEPYIREPMEYTLDEMTVTEGKLFVLGDNRNESDDSHIWGFLDRERLIGRVTMRFWPLRQRINES